MHKHVAAQVPGCYKGLIAALAFVGPLARVNTLMHRQICWLAEPLGTLVAGVGLESLMGSLVATETGGVREHLATLWAEEGLLSRVSAQVRLVGRQLGEALATLLTLVWFALRMDALVTSEGGGAGEGLATVRAEVWLLPSVGALMVFQVLQLCVGFPTLFAGIRPVALVVPPVLSEHRGVSKALPTLCTEIGLFSCVRAQVHFQFRQSGVTLEALGAGVRALSTVLCHVYLQTYGLHEGLTTFCADKRLLSSVGAAVVA